jgi:hypothetical protein
MTLKELALVPPNLTTETLLKLVPLITTVAPVPPVTGVKDDMVGGGKYVNPDLALVPKAFVTTTSPDAPFATTAVMVLEFTTVKEDAVIPPKLTVVVPVKLIPEIVTVDPVAADVGVNELIIGTGA